MTSVKLPVPGSVERVYGGAATLAGLLLVWFAAWTVGVNLLVAGSAHYPAVPWCLGGATLVTALVGWRYGARVTALYAAPISPERRAGAPSPWPVSAVAALAIAFAIHKADGSAGLVAGTAAIAALGWWLAPRIAGPPPIGGGVALLGGIAALTVLLLVLYYLGHRSDGDDANYINLAAGAQRSRWPLLAVDTMVGDGPHRIHLPTYRVQSFELLGAALSTVTGASPIVAIHLLMPAPLLLLAALACALVLVPVQGRDWLASAVLALALLYADTTNFGTWGLHGPLRFFQGKGCLVTTFVPLAAGLTVRFLRRREKVDLLGLFLVHVGAIGLSANGLYVTPAASGLAALAWLGADARRAWRGVAWLLPTLAYPVLVAAVIALRHLALPSEFTNATEPYNSFRFVAGFGPEGLLFMGLVPLAAILARGGAERRAAALYLPLALAATLNPLGWKLVSALTGNLGFRIFWAVPGAILAGAVLARLGRGIGLGGWPLLVLAGLSLGAGIAYNHRGPPETRISWHRPGLRVEPEEYRAAERLAAATPPGCQALVPETVAVWLAGMPGAPYLAVVRSLYLQHYRFTEPRDELASRWALWRMVDGTGRAPSPAALPRQGIRLGLVAVRADAPGRVETGRFARTLGLAGPFAVDRSFIYWRGGCGAAVPPARQGKRPA